MTAYAGLYAAMVLLAAWLVMRWTRSHAEFDLSDIITGDNGRVSFRKCGAVVALISSTWAFVTLVEQRKLTEWHLATYMGVWAPQKVATDIATAAGNKS